MRAEKHIAGQRFENTKTALIVGDNVRVVLIVDERVIRRSRAAHEDDVIGLAAFFNFHRPGRVAFGMAGCKMSDHPDAAEFYRFAIVQDAVGFDRRKGQGIAPLKIAFAAIGQQRRIGFTGREPCAGERF